MLASSNKPVMPRIIKTVFLILTWICLGLTLEIQGPTFKDLKIRTHGSTEQISRAISGRSVGFFVGAVIGGLIVERLEKFCFIMIALCLDVMGIAASVTPWSPSTSFLWAVIFLQGVCEGIINIAGTKLIFHIWKGNASSPLHALHLGYGIGSFIIPNIANPFLAIPRTTGNDNKTPNLNQTYIGTTSTLSEITPAKFIKTSNVHWAYIIVTIILITNSVAFYVFQKLSKWSDSVPQKSKSTIEKTKNSGIAWKKIVKSFDPATCASSRNRFYAVGIFFLLLFFLFNSFGVERIYGKFIRNFAIDQLKFSNDDASLINTSFWITFSIGRFSGFVGAICIPIRVLIIIEVFGTLVSAILLNFLAYNNNLVLWILTQPMAFFMAPLIPSCIAWANNHLDVTAIAVTFLLLGGSLGGMTYMWIIGHFYEMEYRSFLYLCLACGSILLVLVILMTVTTRGFTKNLEEFNNEEEIKVDGQKKNSYVNDFSLNDEL